MSLMTVSKLSLKTSYSLRLSLSTDPTCRQHHLAGYQSCRYEKIKKRELKYIGFSKDYSWWRVCLGVRMHLPSAVQCRTQLKQVDSLRSFTGDNRQSSVSALLPDGCQVPSDSTATWEDYIVLDSWLYIVFMLAAVPASLLFGDVCIGVWVSSKWLVPRPWQNGGSFQAFAI